MFKQAHGYSLVTAVMPNSSSQRVLPALLADEGSNAFTWKARGTLLHDSLWKRFFPPISPAKSMLAMLVPDMEVGGVVNRVVEEGRLHQQATGAVFSTPCDHVFFGPDFHVWPERPGAGLARESHALTENLSILYCIVGHQLADKVSKAAIRAGAHGPIVYYSEGRGLRDRLGWLRITKEHEKEVLMVLADESNADEVFDAMALAGELHLPGKGFMYRLSIDKGMFNLPSRVSHHHYDANMQQIINAIDHLSGHTHWRDQSVFDVGGRGRGVGLDSLPKEERVLKDQICISALVARSQCQGVMDMMLDAGAPGLNLTYARFTTSEASASLAGARVNEEYGMPRSIMDAKHAESLCTSVDEVAERLGFTDLCVAVHPVPAVATYVPGGKDYRQPAPFAFA